MTQMRKNSQFPDLFTPDGFVAGQMIVHALQARRRERRQDGLRARRLEVPRPEGPAAIRPHDHAMLQPMFQVTLVKGEQRLDGQGARHREFVQTAPPVTTVLQA